MKNLFILILFSLLGLLVSCNANDDSNHSEHINQLLKYQGSWNGTYFGEDTGEWEATIDDKGNAVGTINRTNAQTKYELKGAVNAEGKVLMTYFLNGQAIGSMTGDMQETKASGSWTNSIQNLKGDWEGIKK